MTKVLENIARENFRSSGYLTHPRRERHSSWVFISVPRRPTQTTNVVRNALQRRKQAQLKTHKKSTPILNLINVFLRR